MVYRTERGYHGMMVLLFLRKESRESDESDRKNLEKDIYYHATQNPYNACNLLKSQPLYCISS